MNTTQNGITHEMVLNTTPNEQPTRHNVTWTSDEWKLLCELVWKARKNHPADSVVELVRKVQDSLPADRRRKIKSSKDLKPLLKLLSEHDEKLAQIEDETKKKSQQINSLNFQLAKLQDAKACAKTTEEYAAYITDDEVISYFKHRLLTLLTPEELVEEIPQETLLSMIPLPVIAAYSAREMTNTLSSLVNEVQRVQQIQQTKPINPNNPSSIVVVSLPRVVIMGLLPSQQNAVAQALHGRCRVSFHDKNRKDAANLSSGVDYVVLVTRFISHALQDSVKRHIAPNTKLIQHYGGVDRLIQHIEEEIG